MKRFTWLKVLNSPFKTPTLRWHFGEVKIGTPYFLPRKWVRYTKEEVEEAAEKAFTDHKHLNKSYEYWYNHYKKNSKAVPKSTGFNYCDLGWKTKWSPKDIRYEWSPVLSFVFFKWQIACWIHTEYPDNYWTAWLFYELHTDKTKSKRERIDECRKGFSQTWTSYYGCNRKETIDYYTLILKSKYL